VDKGMSIESLGCFGDERLFKVGVDFLKAVVSKGCLVIKTIAENRAEQVRFERFLWNKKVTIDKLKRNIFAKTRAAAKNSKHVLCIQDSSELDFSRRDKDISGMGELRTRSIKGFYMHPMLAVDAKDGFVLGLCGYKDFDYPVDRPDRDDYQEKRRPIEEKNSFRWIECADEAKDVLKDCEMVTFISDRESDIYQYFCRIPSQREHVIVRSNLQRHVSKVGMPSETISNFVEKLEIMGNATINVPRKKLSKTVKGRINNKVDQKSREANIEIRYDYVTLHKPVCRACRKSCDPDSIDVYIVDVLEVRSPNDELADTPLIHWRLITTHPVNSLEDAMEIVEMYRKRWDIEQLFRSAKKGGMQLDQIALSKGECIKKLVFIGLIASCQILQLTSARKDHQDRPASTCFNKNEAKLLIRLNEKYEGKTEKQKNPFKTNSLAWACWIIARMGSWKGYSSEGPPGPSTLKKGLDRFETTMEGWSMAF
jgi:hypothetical protein